MNKTAEEQMQTLCNLIEEREEGYASTQDVHNALADLAVLLNMPLPTPVVSHRMVSLVHQYALPIARGSVAACGHVLGSDPYWGDDESAYDEKTCAACVAVLKLEQADSE